MSIFSVLNFKRKKNMETNQKLSEKEIELKRAEISKKRKEKRDALKCKVVEDRIARNKEIEDLLREYEIEAVYTYRSDRPAEIPAVITETSAFTDMERRITKYACHKVTVVGLTQKSVDIEGKYRMLIGYTIYNPIDNYSKQVGYQEAVKNILKKDQFITVDNLSTSRNKELFNTIAEHIIDEKEVIVGTEK